jgi:hypothetical protein
MAREYIRLFWVAIGVAVAAVGIGAAQLFAGPDLGVADNGDGWRVMCQSGLRPDPDRVLYRGVRFGYAAQPETETAKCRPSAENPYSYRTSQTVLVGLARTVSGGADAARFDLRTLGLFSLGLVGLAFLVAAACAARGRWPVRVALATVGVMALDIGWLAYFVSPLSEAAEILGSLLVLAALPAWLGIARGRAARVAAFAFLLAGSAVLVFAKSQTVVFAPVVAALLVLGRLEAGRLRGRVAGRVVPAVAGMALIALAAGYQHAQGPGFDRINKNDFFFDGVLPTSANPGQTLHDLGLSPTLLRYNGHGWYPYDPQRLSDPAYQHFQRHLTLPRAWLYLAKHPRLSLRMYTKAARGAAQPRERVIGNYPADSPQGQRPTLAERFTPATTPLGWTAAVAAKLFPLTWLAALITGGWLVLRRFPPSWRATGGVLLFLGAGAALSNLAVVLGAGYFSLHKHQTPTAFFTAPLLVILPTLAVGALLPALRRRVTRPAPAEPDPTPPGRPRELATP